MKILAVRGENISSLQSFFEVDFTLEPLASAGVFAISGPTGAGKSTLLDAICLALYHTTPRLSVAPSKDVAVPDADNKEINVSDPRNLLRRGASSGWCEVDYIGADRNRYRARWSVKRAYNSSKGKLQSPQVQLHTLPDKTLIADSVKDVGQQILRTVGLTYSEFTRSVMLAQNEFTSFLRASDNERAMILEKLTGVDVFTKIGVYVFRKTASLEEEKKAFSRTLEQIRILSESERVSVQEQIAGLSARNAAQGQMKNTLTSYQNLTTQLNDSQKSLSAVVKELALRTSEYSELNQIAQLSQQEYVAAVVHKNAAQPQVDQARALEAERESILRQAKELNESLLKQKKALSESQDQLQSLTLKKSRTADELKRLVEWNEQNSRLRKLAEDWSTYDELLSRAEALAAERQHSLELKQKMEITCKQFQQDADKTQQRLSDTAAERSQRQGKLEQLKRVSAEQDLSALLAQVSELEEKRRELERLIESSNNLLRVKTTLDEVRQAKEKDTNLLETYAIQLTDLSKKIEKSKQEQLIALKYKERIERSVSESATAMRAALQPGSPCPVCGSAEHPYAHEQQQPLAELAGEAQSEFNLACRALESLQSEYTNVSTESAKLQVSLGHQRQQLIELEGREKELSIAVAQSGGLGGQPASDSISTLCDRLESLKRTLASKKDDLRSAEKIQSELRQVMQLHEQMEQSWEKDTQELNRLSQELRLHQEKLSFGKKDLDRAESELRQVFLRLDAVGVDSGWQSGFLRHPQEFREKARKEVALWFTQQKENDSLVAQLAELSTQMELLGSNLNSKKEMMSDLQNQLDRLAAAADEVSDKLRSLLGNVPVAEFESKLATTVAAKEKERDTAQQRVQQQQVLVARLETQRVHFDARAQELSAQCEALSRQLDALAQQLNFSWRDAPKHLWLEQLEPQMEQDLGAELKLRGTLEADAQAQRQSSTLMDSLQKLEHELGRWRELSELVGCSTGAKFRKEAHRLTLEVLLSHANYHLESFARRYQLRIPAEGQGLLLEDLDAGGELRSVYSLSGGESFLVSLALAMGLASLSAEQIPVESLFIDEGFGSLDSESLKVALDALDALQSHGRKVGVISHVPEMAERIGVHIEVRPEGMGRSRVLTPQAHFY